MSQSSVSHCSLGGAFLCAGVGGDLISFPVDSDIHLITLFTACGTKPLFPTNCVNNITSFRFSKSSFEGINTHCPANCAI